MATTIKLKNGSGAPLAGDLVAGEPALDLTNKRLYTEDSGGTVIEIGTNPTSLTTGTFTSTGIDDNATSTAITIDSSENVGIGEITPAAKLDVMGPANSTVAYIGGSSDAAPNRSLAITGSNNDRTYTLDSTGASGLFGQLALATNGTEAMRIDSSGNVGIGTSSPTVPFQVVSTASPRIYLGTDASNFGGLVYSSGVMSVRGQGNATSAVVSVDATNSKVTFTTANVSDRMVIDSSGNVGIGTSSPSTLIEAQSTDARITLTHTGGNSLQLYQQSVSSYLFADHDLQIHTNGTERMRIDSSGNVGIGTSSPATIFHVDKPSASCSPRFSSGTGGVFLNMRGANDTHQIQYGDGAGSPTFSFYDNTASAERMRIDSSGNLLVGTTSPISSGRLTVVHNNTSGGQAASFKCTQYAGTLVRFEGGSGLCGSISYSGTTTTYNTSSDERLKENIVDAPAGNIDDIRVRSFDWKADGSHQTYGMVAQELVDVAPEAVTQGETEYDMWGVDYSKLVPMMIKEIQDLKAEVAALKGA